MTEDFHEGTLVDAVRKQQSSRSVPRIMYPGVADTGILE